MVVELPFLLGLSVVMGPGQKILTRDGLDQFFVSRVGLGRVSHIWYWVWVEKISFKNVTFFNFFLFGSGQKVHGSNAGQPLIYCRSKLSSGWVRAHL